MGLEALLYRSGYQGGVLKSIQKSKCKIKVSGKAGYFSYKKHSHILENVGMLFSWKIS